MYDCVNTLIKTFQWFPIIYKIESKTLTRAHESFMT